ncbi:rhodanese-like domain-containing protein [Enterococcus hermanniensis]|uniref:Rhodanese-like domain protein n=1 Tax=Enterococcus hermanniensis TaxID=249189 RepID=A0A1L8TMM1_9ENTE|nr:rhodanese-like domain-containing protein [Enterococcus hermanniensis]OJG45561.1 rhodanese-like domain protein [Enterococcus hermanniensis]
MERSISMEEFYDLTQKQQLNIFDIRENKDYQQGHIPMAQNWPLSNLDIAEQQLTKDQKYYLICQTGKRSAMAQEYLAGQGFNVTSVAGGTTAWPGELSK